MPPSVKDLILILQLFFPRDLSLQQGLYVFAVIISLYPILRLHANQRREPRQPARTGWFKTLAILLTRAFSDELNVEAWPSGLGEGRAEEYAAYICSDLDRLFTLLGLPGGTTNSHSDLEFSRPKPILSTSRLNCIFCPPGDSNLIPTLRQRRYDKIQTVRLLDSSFRWVEATLLIAHCARCSADYYPDRVTYKSSPGTRSRLERLEYDTEFLRVSKHGVWVHREIAVAQEKALHRFHSGWSNFADWVNDCTEDVKRKLTYRQSQRLFLEHFARRLLIAHNKDSTFCCEAHPSAQLLAKEVRRVIGINGGMLPISMSHGCIQCTHVKRYRSDLIQEGAILGGNAEVADMTEPEAVGEGDTSNSNAPGQQPVPANLPDNLPQLEAPLLGSPRGYVRLAVMDGKTIKHREPLYNYKNGRFCETHLELRNTCGIIPCGLPVHHPGALTCATQSHINWHKQFENRFSRLSFPGVPSDILCNPAPMDGSQPDLILIQEDENGQMHQTRAFNTETAEQLNSWLTGFESQLRQMSDVNYDFFIHVLMMIYAETMEHRIDSKGMELSDDFWAMLHKSSFSRVLTDIKGQIKPDEPATPNGTHRKPLKTNGYQGRD
ncbi:hypothetical protein C8R44DRAFT_747906 [Mycena epipterygia]|nr:hypothetical protein C8R44DRAFT_747906 [Mycena epipterygia]